MNFEYSEISAIRDIHFQLSACTSTKTLYESGLYSVNKLLDADHALFFLINEERKPVSYNALGFDTVENIDPLIVEQFYQKYYQLDPLFNYLLDHSVGKTHLLLSPLEIMSDEEFHREKFYRHFIKPYFDNIGSLDNILFLVMCEYSSPIAMYVFFRVKEKSPFGKKQKQFLELLVSPLITNVRRVAVEETVRERDAIISFLRRPKSSAGVKGESGAENVADDLTERETEVSRLVMTGMPNVLIADHLGISIRTVENHLRSVYKKLNIHNRTTLVSIMSN